MLIVFRSSPKEYPYDPERVVLMHDSQRATVGPDQRVEVEGTVWPSVKEVVSFSGTAGDFKRVFYESGGSLKSKLFKADEVRTLDGATSAAGARRVWAYFKRQLELLPSNDPTRISHQRLKWVHPQSALASYLAGSEPVKRTGTANPIEPFGSNLSQREAVQQALNKSISIIDGPPGTGKTQTILNLACNLVYLNKTVAVVSLNNAAVSNVVEKLERAGLSDIVASLGRKEKQEEFFAKQPQRTQREDTENVTNGTLNALDALRARVANSQDAERKRAIRSVELDAYRLEFQHFERVADTNELPDVPSRPLARKSSDRLVEFLAETAVDPEPTLVRRIKRYFRYGSLRSLDPSDSAVVVMIQRAFYNKRIAELEREIGELSAQVDQQSLDVNSNELSTLSLALLNQSLRSRFDGPRPIFDLASYRLGRNFHSFTKEYPIVASSCHSILQCIPEGFLFDYIIVDEASQVDVLSLCLALAAAKNAVVVGDDRQLPHIAAEVAEPAGDELAAYDYADRSALSSMDIVFAGKAPKTLLCEHYRCSPAIIDFCNRAFYGNSLIPYTEAKSDQSMLIVAMQPGNHMRQHNGGGRSSQREADSIAQEVMSIHCAGIDPSDVVAITPYRKQVEKINTSVGRSEWANTIHNVQGREARVVIFSTVLDETWRGRTGLPFVDDPRLVNVAVSRAREQFILVTNNDMMPKSKNIRRLADHIQYHDPTNGVYWSEIVSVFDLLYQCYSQKLEALSKRLPGVMKFKSEDIIYRCLMDLISGAPYSHLRVASQVLLRNLVVDFSALSEEQQRFARTRSAVDFVLYDNIGNRAQLAIEVDGFAFHENNDRQLKRDQTKDSILALSGIQVVRLPTTGSSEVQKVRDALDAL